ncbi:hypothetical protein, partial [Burkholderia sp. LMU1-1-1.1]|uniref:hypothetical protein n=1 Tax=Burkholderia sp. LMU1-1-1.1 TaxID=3135266 RepID=UPI00341AB602
FCLLQDGDDLAVGESGSLHCRTFKKLIEKILLLMAIICRGDYHGAFQGRSGLARRDAIRVGGFHHQELFWRLKQPGKKYNGKWRFSLLKRAIAQ